MVGSPEPQADEDARDRRRAIARSPSARTAQPRRSASTTASSWSTCAREPCGVDGHSRVEPDLAAVQPGRQDRRVDEPRRDGHPAGTPVRDSPRDAARPLGLRPAAGLQPRREDALHGELRRHARSPGTSAGDRRFGRPFTFTHDRGLSDWPDTHPGKFSPDGRLIAVGLKDEGFGSWDARDARPGRRAPAARPAARSTRSRSSRTGGRLRPSPKPAC